MVEYSKDKVLASATVDLLEDGPDPIWELVVTGVAPYDSTRYYTLEAKTDTFAAQEAIRQFVEEMENLRDSHVE